MNRNFLCMGLIVLAVSGLTSKSRACLIATERKPLVWMMPPANNNGRSFRDLFEKDQSDWSRTRARIDVLGYADHWLDTQFSDEELRAWFPLLNKWGLKLGLEVGAIKPWGTTGAKTFGIERKMWDRFQSAGGHIYALAMDEPLTACKNEIHQSTEYAVEETAQFVALVHQNYPDVKIGDIEPYPFFQSDELMAFIDALQVRLKLMHVRGLDFFRLDVDWMHFQPGDPIGQAAWNGVHSVELGCRKRKIPFSLIYWAANYPSLKQRNLATEDTWEASILRQGQSYAEVGGKPDEVVIESWLDTPNQVVPETKPGTFTKSVLDFCQKFLSSHR